VVLEAITAPRRTCATAGGTCGPHPGLSLVTYSVEPGSASEDGLRLLASWAPTQDQLEPDTIS
jgi:hypothetical protein